MLSEEQLDHLIRILGDVAFRPQIHFRNVDAHAVEAFLHGFWVVFQTAVDSPRDKSLRDRVAIERGWKVPTA